MMKAKHRIFVKQFLKSEGALVLGPEETHYIRNVLRVKKGARILVFNGTSGEFEAELQEVGRGGIALRIGRQRRLPEGAFRKGPFRKGLFRKSPAIFFAPIRSGRMSDLVERAVELGASGLYPVQTERVSHAAPSLERIHQIACGALAQSGRLSLPDMASVRPLEKVLASFRGRFFFCAESGPVEPVLSALKEKREAREEARGDAFLIGPEGGFSPQEHDMLRADSRVIAIGLGPAILRSETAVAMVLSCWQAFFCGEQRPDDALLYAPNEITAGGQAE